MRRVKHTDEQGRIYFYDLPDDAPEMNAEMGILIGPPDVADSLGLPEPFATRLHNELANRNLLSYEDVQKSPNQLQGVVMAVIKLDAQRLHAAFLNENNAILNGR